MLKEKDDGVTFIDLLNDILSPA